MNMVPWRPWRELQQLRHSLDRLFWEPLAAGGQVMGHLDPRLPMEVLEQNGEVLVRAELPGVDPKDIEVRITDDGITVRGERKLAVNQNRDGIHHTERYYGSFARTLAFPAPVDSAQARAAFHNGVLEVRAPRRQAIDGRDGRRLDIDTH